MLKRCGMRKRDITPNTNKSPNLRSDVTFKENMVRGFHVAITRRTRNRRQLLGEELGRALLREFLAGVREEYCKIVEELGVVFWCVALHEVDRANALREQEINLLRRVSW
ncbi:hypothetical protein Tco_0318371 [Tanacetum coccineum]